MYQYNIIHWMFFFYFYCFFGWCFESIVVSVKKRHFVNRGFMRGPFLPLYGTGALMMLIVSMPFQDNVLLTYIAGCIGATVLEYVTGVTMEALFKVRYWDYSDQKFNFQGHVCLSSSLAWGFLTILMTKVMHKPVEQFVLAIPRNVLMYVTLFLTIYITVDFSLSFKAAMDLRDILTKMQRVKDEMERMQKRLDVIIAIANEEKEQRKQEHELRMDELAEELEQRFYNIKEHIQNTPGEYMDNVKEEIAELRGRFNLYMENRKHYKEMLGFFKVDMIRNNPSMISKKFKYTLEDLKNIVEEKRTEKKKDE
ncbi:MAG: hypothetical protein J6B68_08905 [Lachnospiraceae bacterium]|nr:hypothetical protein [Lachnospiraceae bacterium]